MQVIPIVTLTELTAVTKMWYAGTQMKAYKYFAIINLEYL
jgi:hypothetical protein